MAEEKKTTTTHGSSSHQKHKRHLSAEEKKLNERECKIKTIALSTIITFVFNMSSFNLDQTVVDALKVTCAEKYKINIKDIPDLGTEQRTESFVSNAEPRDSTASVPGKSG